MVVTKSAKIHLKRLQYEVADNIWGICKEQSFAIQSAICSCKNVHKNIKQNAADEKDMSNRT